MSSVMPRCPACGCAGGRDACRELFDDVALRVRSLAWTDSLKTWRLMHDVYAIQHADDACPRYADLVLHLGGVCWGLEHGGTERGYRALQKLVDRDPWKSLPYPLAETPAARGTISVASLKDLAEPVLLINGVDRWARAAWVAYVALQPHAREWVQQAVALDPPRQR